MNVRSFVVGMMVVALRLAEQTFAKLNTALDRLCAKEERTWKERLLNSTQPVSLSPLSSRWVMMESFSRMK